MNINTIISYLEAKEEYISKEELGNMKETLLKIERLEKQKLLNIKEEGDLEFKKGNYKKACELYSKYIDISPEDYTILSNRAACFHKLKLVEESIKDCKRGIEINPTFLKFYLRLGVLLININIEESIYYLEKGLELKPDDIVIKEQLEIVKTLRTPMNSILSTDTPNSNNQSINENKNCNKDLNEQISEIMRNEEYNETVKNIIESKSLEELQDMIKEMMNRSKIEQ